jgi:hypothetical protein
VHEEINTVIALTTVHRVDDPIFLEILDRLRWGKCGLADYKYMQSLIGTRELKPDFESYWWQATKCAKASTKHSGPTADGAPRSPRIRMWPAFRVVAFHLRRRVLKRNMSPELGLSNSTRIVLRRILWKGDPAMYVDDAALPPLKLSVAPEILVFETRTRSSYPLGPFWVQTISKNEL